MSNTPFTPITIEQKLEEFIKFYGIENSMFLSENLLKYGLINIDVLKKLTIVEKITK